MEFGLEDLEEKYELGLDMIVAEISGKNVKSVLIQLPDGLKPYGLVICDEIGKRLTADGLDVDVRIWLGDCFGACDLPVRNLCFLRTSSSDCDLVVQFGHALWK